MEPTVVLDEAHLPEFVHEKIHARTSCTDHLRQHLLRNFRENPLRLILLAVTGEQQQGASKTLFAGVEKLIDQVLFDADVPGKHVRDEAVGKRMFRMKDANHFFFSITSTVVAVTAVADPMRRG